MKAIEFSDDLAVFDFPRITAWLAASYWSPGIEEVTVEQGARNSTVCAGAFIDGRQVAYGRVVSDTTRFAYLADVIVDDAFRGQGLGRRLTRFLLQHQRVARVEHWYLITRDAQDVYAPLGFTRFDPPDRTVMVLHR